MFSIETIRELKEMGMAGDPYTPDQKREMLAVVVAQLLDRVDALEAQVAYLMRRDTEPSAPPPAP
jgi:hypothetical protein